MIALIIVGAFLLLILAVLFLPVSVIISVEEQFSVKIKMASIKLFGTTTKKDEEEKKTSEKGKEKKKKTEKKSDGNNVMSVFVSIKEEKGFAAAVKAGMELAGRCFKQIKKLLKHISIEKVKLGITVASNDAAKTAIDYGIVCQAVYPVMALLNDFANVKFKEINVTSDFVAQKPSFRFGATVKLQIFYLLVTAIKLYIEWKNFITELNENERTKQH